MDKKKMAKLMKPYGPRNPDAKPGGEQVYTPETRRRIKQMEEDRKDKKFLEDSDKAYRKAIGMKKGGMVTKGCGMARPQKFRVM